MMRCCSKEKITSNGKTENGICHVCPSKLSKRELEDLYFTLMQNNIELKKTINQLGDKIKYQTTKLQRMLSTQRSYMGTEQRDCCATAKSIVQEQKLVIIELKNANDNLQEQVNNLNIKLCSTKQFMKRATPAKNTPFGKNKASVRTDSAKNSSSSALHAKCAEDSTTGMKSVSCQYLESVASSGPRSTRKQKTVQNKSVKTGVTNNVCDQNKCKTQMEEMQQRILKLQEELSKTHDEYSNRIARLEREVIDLHSENMRVCSEKAVWKNNMTAQSNEASNIKKKLAETESLCEQLSANLKIEKGKVAELQTQIKAANMTGGAMKTIEERLYNENTKNARRDSVGSTRSTIDGRPEAYTNETKYIENKNMQQTTSRDKNNGLNGNVKSGYTNGSRINEDPDGSKFPENEKGSRIRNFETESNNFRIVPNCCGTGFDNTTEVKSVPAEGQREPVSRYNTNYDNKDLTAQNKARDIVTLQGNSDERGTGYNYMTSRDTVVPGDKQRDNGQDIARSQNMRETDKNRDNNVCQNNICNPCTLARKNTLDNRQDNKDLRINDNQDLQGNRNRPPGDNNQFFEDQTTSNKLQNRRTSTSRDNVQYRENFNQDSPENREGFRELTSRDGDRYRENLTSRLRNKDKDRRTNVSPRDTDTPCGNEDQIKEQEVRGRRASATSRLDNNDVQDGGDNRQESKDRRLSVSPRGIVDKNLESGAGQCLKPGDGPVDYTTEYRSQYNIPRRNSRGFQAELESPEKQTTAQKPLTQSNTLYGTDAIPEINEKGNMSPPMAQLVNKSNESSCFCSGRCQCVNSIKNIPPPANTAVTATTPPRAETAVTTTILPCAGTAVTATTPPRADTAVTAFASSEPETEAPLTAEDEAIMRKFMSLFIYTPIELGETPSQQARRPVGQQGETSEKFAVDTSTAKTADDSGFTEPATSEEKALMRENQELEKRVVEMQAQLDQLKTHVLSRKNTYTVFKDEGTLSDAEQKSEFGTQKATIPLDASAQTDNRDVRVDPRRVCLKVPRKGYVVIEQPDQENQRAQGGKCPRTVIIGPKYNSPGPSNPDSSCESTCGKEGLPCTEECMLKNNNKDTKQLDGENYNKNKGDNNRYQIPGPLSTITPTSQDKKNKPDNDGSNEPATRRMYHQNYNALDLQPTQTSTTAPRQFDEKNGPDKTSQNTNFYEGNNTNVQQTTGFIKEESPPMNRTQNMTMKDTSTNPTTQTENLNARYARETPPFHNNQLGKNWDEPQVREPARTAQYTDDPIYQNQKKYTESTTTSKPEENCCTRNQKESMTTSNPEENCCTRNQKLQETLANSKPTDSNPVENVTKSSNDMPVQNTSRAGKKISVKCMCPRHQQYTTNVLHTATVPNTAPNYEYSKNQVATSKFSAENATSSNTQQYDLHQKNNVTQNSNDTNVRDINKMRTVPGFSEGLGASSSEKRESYKFEESERSNITKPATNAEDKKQLITFEEKAPLFNRASINEANRIQREKPSDPKEGFKEKKYQTYDDVQRNPTMDTGDRRNSRLIDNRNKNGYVDNLYENSFVAKSGTEVNNANKINKENHREAHFKDNASDFESNKNIEEQNPLHERRPTRYVDMSGREKPKTDNKSIDEMNSDDKLQRRYRPGSHFVDVNGREKQFVENDTQHEILNVVKKQEEKRHDNRLPGRISDLNNDTKNTRREDFEQPNTTPVATSSPFNCTSKNLSQNPKTDRATDNQLGTQQGNTDDDKEAEPNTYTIEASANVVRDKEQKVIKCSRATSPENTDQEISSLTDLPSERETTMTPLQSTGCSKCARYSPGEDKSTTAKSEPVTISTSSTPKSISFPLSEGEMPQYSARSDKQRADSLFIDPQAIEEKRKVPGESSTEKVEKALATISEELAKCRQLLEKPKETQSLKQMKENTVRLKDLREYEKHGDDGRDGFEERRDPNGPILRPKRESSSYALHHAQAKAHISNGPDTPHVMFTLHIGTIVLSDEAVINSRNLTLVLTWKFYDQNVAMSHMRPGRVVHFDFSTEYDLKLTDRLLQYLKTEELQIKVCEVHKLDLPLASCSLPLREALLHTNRRADMSLALVAGSYPLQRSTPDSLDTRDEMGVLDLWCMLRAESRILPLINKTIAKSRPSRFNGTEFKQNSVANSSLSPLITQLDDDQDDMRLSADLDQTFQQNERVPVYGSPSMIDRGPQTDRSNRMRRNHRRQTNYGYVEPSETGVTQSTNAQFAAYPSARPRVSISAAPPHMYPERLSTTNTDIMSQFSSVRPNKTEDREDRWLPRDKGLKRTASGFIVNEVPAAIRSDEQMKQAVTERSKLNSRFSMAPTLQGKYAEAQARTRPEPRMSYGQISVPSLRHTRRNSTTPDDHSSLNLGPTAYSVSRDWKKTDNKDPVQNEPTKDRRDSYYTMADKAPTSRFDGTKKAMEAYKTVKDKREGRKLSPQLPSFNFAENNERPDSQNQKDKTIVITILWLALNEECAAMSDTNVQRLYVAYSFLGRGGADLETPLSLPKPKQYQDKCYFNFKKSFQLTDADMETLGRMARCRFPHKGTPNPKESVVFTVVSEPVEDPLGLNNCEDIGTAYLYFGDLIAYSAGSDTYTEVIPIRDAKAEDCICGVLSIRVDGLNIVRKCLTIY